MFHLPKLGKKISTPNIVYFNFLKQRLQTVHINHVKNFGQNHPESKRKYIFNEILKLITKIIFQKISHHSTI